MRKVFLHLSSGAKKQKVARKKEKELPRKGDEEDEEALAKKKTRSGHLDNQREKEVVGKKKSLVMTFAARKRWKLAKNMFIALRRSRVGAMAGIYFRDYIEGGGDLLENRPPSNEFLYFL